MKQKQPPAEISTKPPVDRLPSSLEALGKVNAPLATRCPRCFHLPASSAVICPLCGHDRREPEKRRLCPYTQKPCECRFPEYCMTEVR